jgi:hypothetical protein
MNFSALPVPRGTISIMLNSANKDYGFNLSNLKKQIPPKSKFKMKWKAIQWLLEHKRGNSIFCVLYFFHSFSMK